jgi:hypothetical protein
MVFNATFNYNGPYFYTAEPHEENIYIYILGENVFSTL